MEDVVAAGSRPFWKGRSVLITGHTGFKGSWLSLWLDRLGAAVHGYALEPPTTPNLFSVARVHERLATDTRADVADLTALNDACARARPEVVFHLAAQPLVLESYRNPQRTFETNVLGTANVLEAVRRTDSVRAVVVITTDKVYENLEQGRRYAESDPLGGRDPYSASKASAEQVTMSYRQSFFGDGSPHHARIATARSGNVIGGGDWADDRLVPDCLRAFASGKPVRLRHSEAVRPWQHVFDPLAGYLLLAERLCRPDGDRFARAWNFGPTADAEATVGDVAEVAARCWGSDARVERDLSDRTPHEAGLLRLDSTLARNELDWRPAMTLDQAVSSTVLWHRAWLTHQQMPGVCSEQLTAYETAMSR